MKVRANGILVNYEMAGAGPCLTLIHGAADNSGVWYKQVPEFSRRYTVLTYDIRGSGDTEVPDGDLTTDTWVEDLRGLLDALKIKSTYLLGTSRGGMVATEFTLRYPERVKALILPNCSVSASLRRFPVAQLRAGNLESMAAIEREGMAAVVRNLIPRMFTADFIQKDPETVRRYTSIVMGNDPQRYSRILKRPPPTTTPDLSAIPCPVLIIGSHSDADIDVATFKALRDAIPGARLVMLNGGHLTPLESPVEHNQAVLQFLAEIEGAAGGNTT